MKACEVNQRDWLHEGYADASASAVIVKPMQHANRELDAMPAAPDYRKLEKRVRDYRAAQASAAAASAVLAAHVFGGTRPTANEIRAEECASVRFLAASRRLYVG
jgi:hypothetical protein